MGLKSRFLRMTTRKSRRPDAAPTEFSAELTVDSVADSEVAEIQALPKLMQRKEWPAVRRMFSVCRTRNGQLQFLRVPVFSSEDPGAVETMLHMCLRLRAPLDIVHEVVLAYPEALCLPDDMGRYPLHVAAECGASLAVMKLLLKHNQGAALEQDCTGKTPLHLVCASYTSKVPRDSSELLDVVTHLARAAPSSVDVEDREGMRPLEYAIAEDCPFRVVKLLQTLSDKDDREELAGAAAGVEECFMRSVQVDFNAESLTDAGKIPSVVAVRESGTVQS